jgi:hypothetical protein
MQYWFSALDVYFKTIEMDVSDEEVFLAVKSFFKPECTHEEIMEHINNPFFKRENLIENIRNERVLSKAVEASLKIRKMFAGVLEEIVKDKTKQDEE